MGKRPPLPSPHSPTHLPLWSFSPSQISVCSCRGSGGVAFLAQLCQGGQTVIADSYIPLDFHPISLNKSLVCNSKILAVKPIRDKQSSWEIGEMDLSDMRAKERTKKKVSKQRRNLSFFKTGTLKRFGPGNLRSGDVPCQRQWNQLWSKRLRGLYFQHV